jgi:hypothetical protein
LGSGSDFPCLESFVSEDAESVAECEMALVEGVEDRGVTDRKRWADPGDLKRCILRLRRRVD